MPQQQVQTDRFDGPINLLNQEYLAKSIDQNQSQLTNMYLEPDQSRGKYAIVAYPMPGLLSFCDTTKSSVRALFAHNDILYAIAGNKFYRIASNGTKTELGTLNTSSGFAKIVAITGGNDNNNQLIMIDGTNGYHYNIGTSTATFPIVDEDFPQTAIDICASDDYVIVQAIDSISFFISNLADGTAYNALDFASKTGEADKVTAIGTNQRHLYLMGNKTTEVYYNSGNPLFPYERVNDVFIHHGCAAKRSVALCGEFLTFLAKSANGGYKVVQLQGYVARPIGNPATDYQIGLMTTKSDAIGYCYLKDGRDFYDLTFPTDGKTFTFDLATGAMESRQSYVSGSYTRFLAQCSAFCYDKQLVGDFSSGQIYAQDANTYTENGTPIRRVMVSPPLYQDGKRIFVHKLQVEVESNIGSSKTFTVEKSFDGGRTWLPVSTFTVGTDANTRLYKNGLGQARNWMFRVTTTMDAKFIILGFIVEASLGDM